MIYALHIHFRGVHSLDHSETYKIINRSITETIAGQKLQRKAHITFSEKQNTHETENSPHDWRQHNVRKVTHFPSNHMPRSMYCAHPMSLWASMHYAYSGKCMKCHRFPPAKQLPATQQERHLLKGYHLMAECSALTVPPWKVFSTLWLKEHLTHIPVLL